MQIDAKNLPDIYDRTLPSLRPSDGPQKIPFIVGTGVPRDHPATRAWQILRGEDGGKPERFEWATVNAPDDEPDIHWTSKFPPQPSKVLDAITESIDELLEAFARLCTVYPSDRLRRMMSEFRQTEPLTHHIHSCWRFLQGRIGNNDLTVYQAKTSTDLIRKFGPIIAHIRQSQELCTLFPDIEELESTVQRICSFLESNSLTDKGHRQQTDIPSASATGVPRSVTLDVTGYTPKFAAIQEILLGEDYMNLRPQIEKLASIALLIAYCRHNEQWDNCNDARTFAEPMSQISDGPRIRLCEYIAHPHADPGNRFLPAGLFTIKQFSNSPSLEPIPDASQCITALQEGQLITPQHLGLDGWSNDEFFAWMNGVQLCELEAVLAHGQAVPNDIRRMVRESLRQCAIDPMTLNNGQLLLDHDHPCELIIGPNKGGKSVFLQAIRQMLTDHAAGRAVRAGTGTEIQNVRRVFHALGVPSNGSKLDHTLRTMAAFLAGTNGVFLGDEVGQETNPAIGALMLATLIEQIYTTRCGIAMVATHLAPMTSLNEHLRAQPRSCCENLEVWINQNRLQLQDSLRVENGSGLPFRSRYLDNLPPPEEHFQSMMSEAGLPQSFIHRFAKLTKIVRS